MNKRYRRAIVAANWKMNGTGADARAFIARLKALLPKDLLSIAVLCPPMSALESAVRAAKGSRLAVGAQNCHWEEKGAYTGEVSCGMLEAGGVRYVIIGHSERRQYFGETDQTVNQKLLAALRHGLHPILCVGESLAVRQAGAAHEHVCAQLKMALHTVPAENLKRIVVAYEPVWAIGTGLAATPEDASAVCGALRASLRDLYDARKARAVSILYGGSITEQNASALFAMPDIDGGLVGGASLSPDTFAAIVSAAGGEDAE